MVEDPRGCVLQSAGHAGYVTERFSGLLARQALVDVTLVCEEQKLRVHKLVLASNSIYFEEILQHDLGQEPIIFLKDLNFEILKAMVEFMYCGETTISHQLLPSLLAATKTFKVKELASVIETMMTSNISPETSANIQIDICGSKFVNSVSSDMGYMRVKYAESDNNESSDISNSSNNDTNPSENQSLESSAIIDTNENELEHTLYEESQDSQANEKQISTSLVESAKLTTEDNSNSLMSTQCTLKDGLNLCSESSAINDNTNCSEPDLKPILYEQCCDFSDIDDCEKNSMSLPRSSLQQTEKDVAQYSFENADVPGKVGKCVKVYSHKRRKSSDDVKNKLTHVNNIIPSPQSTDCIDLLEEPSSNDIPVTLLTSLDMESAEYIISLSTESIQSIVGAQVNDQRALIKCDEMKHIIDYDNQKENVNKKESCSESSDSSDCVKPILRRSLRLNQHDSDETHSNESVKESTVGERQLKKSCSLNNTDTCVKGKRKIRDTDRKVPEQSVNNVVQSSRKNITSTRTQRNTNKLIVKKSNKSCSATNKEKDEQRVKTGSKSKCDVSGKIEMNAYTSTSPKLNTIEHINRALWGDMSDVSEGCQNRMDLLEFTPHTEIPFAVGLLPLRTALEKMQATPDYQPRKTRSSVAPIRQDVNTLKRKSLNCLDTAILSKKQNNTVAHTKENASTVCHIQIRAAPSAYVRSRKKFLTTSIPTLESPAVTNRQ